MADEPIDLPRHPLPGKHAGGLFGGDNPMYRPHLTNLRAPRSFPRA